MRTYIKKNGNIFSEDYFHSIGGGYDEWDFKEQQLKGFRTFKVILKSLENVNNANPSWLDGFVDLLIKQQKVYMEIFFT
ncbi:kinase-like domain-containing protein [Rhizophagus irregularis DAOM 181602=DAOM 197198]|nr:kinase-like domain-containing protein [Rhizophagus irregularis DAOM 181602=DAOM 197198]